MRHHVRITLTEDNGDFIIPLLPQKEISDTKGIEGVGSLDAERGVFIVDPQIDIYSPQAISEIYENFVNPRGVIAIIKNHLPALLNKKENLEAIHREEDETEDLSPQSMKEKLIEEMIFL